MTAFTCKGSEGDVGDSSEEGWAKVTLGSDERHFCFRFKRIQKNISAMIQRSADRALDSRFQASQGHKVYQTGRTEGFHIYPLS